jgi:hypothetical protein
MKAERGWTPEYEKTASVDVLGELFGAVPKDPPIESQINHWRKVAEELRVSAGAEMQWDAAMEELLGHSKRIYWKRDDFEKDAMALFGGDVLEINALRTSSKLEPLPATYETAEKLASHLFGEETEDTRLVKRAADARQNYMKASKALEIAKTKVAALVAQVVK